MGSTSSKPIAPESEKAIYASSSSRSEMPALHHAADRLARIQAESTLRQASSPQAASPEITHRNVQDWKDDAFAVR